MRNRTENQIILTLIRHGETEGNAQRRYLGKTDEPLSKHGRRLLQSSREQRRYPQADYLFLGPMRRCVETAEILYPGLEPVVIPEWKEIDFGRFEYKNYEELRADEAYQRWIASKGAADFPEGESRDGFALRCESGLQRMCRELQRTQTERQADFTKFPLRVSAIVHGGIIMALLSAHVEEKKRKGYFDYQIENGGGYLCRTIIRKPDAVSGKEIEGEAEMEIWIEETVKL